MWIQVALPLLGFLVLSLFLNLNGTISVDDVIGNIGLSPFLFILFILGIATTVLTGVLAASYSSRKRWVRIAALVVEGFMILDGGYGFVSGASLGSLLNLVLAGVVVFQLSRPVAVAWFDR
ncbi:hypothetical protein ACSDR0_45385 [Streptosporangium sp. G11]|uniref:hypothetical protein n=1 Tax=Streptosporangium sp. G11 TaxID=3436926 RepID=UPI003EBAAB34